MDPELEQRIRDAYAAFVRGDIDAALERLLPEATFTNPDYAVEDGVRRGRDEVRAGMQALHEGFEYAALDVEQLIEGPGGLLVMVRMDARGRGSGAPFQNRFAHVFRMHDGHVVDFAWFKTIEEGRRAIGLA